MMNYPLDILIENTVRKYLAEMQGVSDEVSAMSERIMQGILSKADSIGWNEDQRFVNQDGETMKSKIFRLDTRSLGLQQYANDIMVYLFGFDENESITESSSIATTKPQMLPTSTSICFLWL